jgi:prepilin-type N-terminal cleavage/methylation domain-containing protein
MKKINLKSTSGFSLIEFTIAIAVVSMIIVSIWDVYSSTNKTNDFLSKNLNSQGEVRKAFAAMSASIRSASVSSIGAYPIESASSTTFVFYSDINHDGLKERIRYFFSGNTLKQGILIPTGNPLTYNTANEKVAKLINNVLRTASSSFAYYGGNYDGTGTSLASPVNILSIRLVKITVLVDNDPTKSPSALIFTTQTSIRNLKDNL